MGAMAGKDGVVKLATVKIGYMDNFSIAINQGTAEVSSLGDDWKKHIPTSKDWSGSFSGTFDYADASQKKIVDGLITGPATDAELSFKCNDGLELAGKAIISSVSITGSHGDKIAVSANFTGNGALEISPIV